MSDSRDLGRRHLRVPRADRGGRAVRRDPGARESLRRSGAGGGGVPARILRGRWHRSASGIGAVGFARHAGRGASPPEPVRHPFVDRRRSCGSAWVCSTPHALRAGRSIQAHLPRSDRFPVWAEDGGLGGYDRQAVREERRRAADAA